MYNILMSRALLVLAMVLLGLGSVSARVPEIKKQCDICHISHAMGGGALLKAPLSELCLDCHQDRKSPGDHVVDITPSMPVGNLPLDDGIMTCVTCHDPHSSGEYPKMLRDKPGRLCSRCHKM